VGRIDLDGSESNEEIFGAVADSWKSGFDAIQFRNYTTPDGTKGSFVLVKDPSQLRSINATFDPAKEGSPNLMAGVSGATVGLGALLQGEQAAANDFYQRRAAKKPKWQAMRSRAEMTSRLGQAAPVEHELLGDLANKFAAYNQWVKSKPGLDFILPEAPVELVDKWSYGQPTTLADDAEAALGLL
jgi:TPP-dependent trihydroxycyclohexane-1,2-dione (THcHDO) dehydratase